MTVSEFPAAANASARNGPTHGAAQMAKAPPSRTREPLLRAPWISPPATSRSVHGSNPMNANPATTRMNPASACFVWSLSTPAIRLAVAPSATKTIAKPAMNGRLANATRRPTPESPSLCASTADTAER